MDVQQLLAQMTVSNLGTAVDWYTRLFGRIPDTRPMDGLVEWHLSSMFGVQVWADPDRAGRSTMVLVEADLDALVADLDCAGIAHSGPQQASSSRIVMLADPDGNTVVFAGA
ncbi:MAG: VOC family protein [Mycobacterium sp.]